jgi:hypothetical protein
MKKRSIVLFLVLFLQFGLSQHKPDASGKKPEANTPGTHKITMINMMVRTAPSFTIQVNGMYDYGVFELSGKDNGDFNANQFILGENFGVRHGIGGSITAKIPLHQRGNIRLNISVLYNNFGNKLIDMKDGGYAKYNVFSGGVGIENNFTPSFKIKTLIGASLIGSVISGKAFIVLPDKSYNLNINPAFRLGVMVYSGFEYLLSNNLGFNFGFNFTHANLWFKSSKVSNDPNSINLNDKRVTPRQPYTGWKQFAWGSFYGGLNIYFGIKEKNYYYRK